MSLSPTISRTFSPWRETLRFAAFAAVLGAAIGMAPLGFGEAHGAQASQLRISGSAYGRSQQVEVGLNKSMIVDLPADVSEVIVSEPSVAGVIMRSKRRAILQGNAAGGTNIFFLDTAGNAMSVLEVSVTGDSHALASTLRRLLPGSAIDVQSFGERIILSGSAQSQDDVQKALAIAGQFAGSEDSVTSVINIAGSQQVMLKVAIAEVNRTAANQLGINISASVNANGFSTSLISPRGTDPGSASGTPAALSISGSIGPLSIDASLRALASRNAVRLLAEPLLTAMSGQDARFLVGGEFPIRVIDPQTNMVTTEFKEYGVRLGFTPTVRSDGIIGLEVETEVSEIVTPEGQLSTRRAQTSVELPVGKTLAIGGLLQDNIRQQINRLPLLGDIPILGTLFRSRDFLRSQTELVILVTPYLAYPGHQPELPTDRYVPASDAEGIFLGRMEAMYGVGPQGMRGSYSGSVGFVLD